MGSARAARDFAAGRLAVLAGMNSHCRDGGFGVGDNMIDSLVDNQPVGTTAWS
jgi:hypothetical protein